MADIQEKKSIVKFSPGMLDAILDGSKTVTRRAIKPQPDTTEEWLRKHDAWVEGLTLSQHINNAWRSGFVEVECPYGEPGDRLETNGAGEIEITDVQIQMLHEISIGQICKEGLARSIYEFIPVTTAFDAFAELWNSLGGDWDANPWVWVIEFKRIDAHQLPANG